MSPVAKWLLLRVLAATKCDPLSLLERHFDRGKLRARMGAVEEWLCL